MTQGIARVFNEAASPAAGAGAAVFWPLLARLGALAAVVAWAAALLLISTSAGAAARIKGYVVLNEEKGAPVPQVQISADGENQVSRSDGSFVLNFAQRQAGEVVRVVVQRAGWDVVNRHALEHTLLASALADARPLEIVLAQAAQRDERAVAFYRLKGIQVVDQDQQRKLAELERRQAATAEERARLRQERDQALKRVDELARLLANAKPAEASAIYNQAIKLFGEGQLDQALELLSEKRLDEEGARVQAIAAQAQADIRKTAEGWQLRAQMLALKLDFAGASLAHKKATELLPQDPETWFQYAYFHQRQNQWVAARLGYERALGLSRQSGEPSHIADILNNLGELHRVENRQAEARAAYEEALKYRRALVQKNPDVYLSDLASTLNNLGNLHSDENRMAEAGAAYEEAFKHYRVLVQKSPDVYLPDLASTLNNLGNLLSAENRKTEARAAYEEALKHRRALVQKNPDVYLPDLAMTLNDLGALHSAEKRMAEARAAYEEAIKYRRALAQKNPDVYLPDLAMTLNNLGYLHSIENRKIEARAVVEESLAIYQRFVLKSEGFRANLNKVQANLDQLDK